MSDTPLEAGWWYALNARKAHYYLEGEAVSLCRRQMTLGGRYGTEDNNHDSADNCAECKRRRAARPAPTVS